MPQGRSEGLLDCQVEYGFLLGSEFNGALAQPTDGLGHGEYAGPGRARDVPVDPDSRDEPDAFEIAPADLGAEHPWRNHPHVTGWIQPPKGEGVSAGHDHDGVGAGLQRQGSG